MKLTLLKTISCLIFLSFVVIPAATGDEMSPYQLEEEPEKQLTEIKQPAPPKTNTEKEEIRPSPLVAVGVVDNDTKHLAPPKVVPTTEDKKENKNLPKNQNKELPEK